MTANMFNNFTPLSNLLVDTIKFVDKTASNYPPYNIKQIDKNKYVIEMAVAGFGEQDIELTLEDTRLLVKGTTKSEDADTGTYLFKGIAGRGFQRAFNLRDDLVVENAQLLNGMLRVWLDMVIPESKKPKKIEINKK